MSSDAINVELRLSCKNTESHTSTDVSRILPCYLFPPCPPAQRTEVFFQRLHAPGLLYRLSQDHCYYYICYTFHCYTICAISNVSCRAILFPIYFSFLCATCNCDKCFFFSLFCWILASVLHTPCLCFFYENFSAFFLFGSDLLSSSLLWDKRAKDVVNFSLLMMHSMRVLQQRINAIHVR